MPAHHANLSADWWTTSDVAAYLQVTLGTVSTYVRRGQIVPPDRRIGRTRVWLPARIIEWDAARPRVQARRLNKANRVT